MQQTSLAANVASKPHRDKNHTEVWRPIKGYEGLYEVRSHGRIKSIERMCETRGRGTRLQKGIILKKIKRLSDGYLFVNLYKNGVRTKTNTHRIIAQAFIPNPNNLPQVNHINSDKSCDSISNLEWVSAHGNAIHAVIYGNNKCTSVGRGEENRRPYTALHKDTPNKKEAPIIQYDINMNELNRFRSISEACRGNKHLTGSNISMCAKGKRKSHGGYYWAYQNDYKIAS